jgi:hypothetical protein
VRLLTHAVILADATVHGGIGSAIANGELKLCSGTIEWVLGFANRTSIRGAGAKRAGPQDAGGCW